MCGRGSVNFAPTSTVFIAYGLPMRSVPSDAPAARRLQRRQTSGKPPVCRRWGLLAVPSMRSAAPPAVLTVVANRYAANHHRQNRYSLRLQVLGV